MSLTPPTMLKIFTVAYRFSKISNVSPFSSCWAACAALTKSIYKIINFCTNVVYNSY